MEPSDRLEQLIKSEEEKQIIAKKARSTYKTIEQVIAINGLIENINPDLVNQGSTSNDGKLVIKPSYIPPDDSRIDNYKSSKAYLQPVQKLLKAAEISSDIVDEPNNLCYVLHINLKQPGLDKKLEKLEENAGIKKTGKPTGFSR